VTAPVLPRVRVALHRRTQTPLLAAGAPFGARLRWLGDEACAQLRQALDVLGRPAALHLVCTTSLSKAFSTRPDHQRALLGRLRRQGALQGGALLQAYQCAGWGWALRFALTHTDSRFLVLSIIDADLHDYWTAGFEPLIGRLGYGVSTVALELPPGAESPRCEGPFANRGFTDLLHAVRAIHRRCGRTPTFLPFLTEGLSAIANRTLGADLLAPNRHDHYGHAFGADPWIGLIEHLQAHPAAQDSTVTLGAFAYDGYFTLANLQVGRDTVVGLDDGQTLEAAA